MPVGDRKAKASAPQAAPKAEAVTARSQAGAPPPISSLLLVGNFAEQVTVVRRSMSTVILATGLLEDDDRPVLVPFVDMTFVGARQRDMQDDGEGEPEFSPIFAETLSLDNALWLTFDVVRDIRLACARLRGMIDGPAAFDAARIGFARHFAEQLRKQAEMCVSLLDEWSQAAAPDVAPPPPPPAAEPAPASKAVRLKRRAEPSAAQSRKR